MTKFIDPRVKQLVRDNKGTRLHILIVLWAIDKPASSAADIAREINCSADTVEDLLPRMEADGYVSRLQIGRHAQWSITGRATQLALPNLTLSEGCFLPPDASSSSDLSVPTVSEGQKSEEEEESTLAERTAIADDYRLTGDYRSVVISDPWITRERFEGWYRQAQAEQKRSPAAYAVRCCQNHHEPPEEESIWRQDLNRYRNRSKP